MTKKKLDDDLTESSASARYALTVGNLLNAVTYMQGWKTRKVRATSFIDQCIVGVWKIIFLPFTSS